MQSIDGSHVDPQTARQHGSTCRSRSRAVWLLLGVGIMRAPRQKRRKA